MPVISNYHKTGIVSLLCHGMIIGYPCNRRCISLPILVLCFLVHADANLDPKLFLILDLVLCFLLSHLIEIFLH